MNKYLDIAPEVRDALNAGKPVVALESTIISHGMPYPQNVETALNVERIVRENGAVPATIAILGGRLKAGLQPAAEDGDGGGHRAVLAHDALHVEGGLHILRVGHAVGDDGGFQRHHRLSGIQRVAHLRRDIQILVH